MAFILCNHNRRRAITNGSIPLFLNRDPFHPYPPIRFFDVMIQRPFPPGFWGYQLDESAQLCFLAQTQPESVLFFNVGYLEPSPEEVPILFFNVTEEIEDPPFECEGSVLFFNVYEEQGMMNESPILFFNVSEEEVCQ